MARTKPRTRKNEDPSESEGSDSEESVHEATETKKRKLDDSEAKPLNPPEKPPAADGSGSSGDQNREPSVQTDEGENKPPAGDGSNSPVKNKSGGGVQQPGSPQPQASADDMKPAQGPEDAVENEVAETPEPEASQVV